MFWCLSTSEMICPKCATSTHDGKKIRLIEDVLPTITLESRRNILMMRESLFFRKTASSLPSEEDENSVVFRRFSNILRNYADCLEDVRRCRAVNIQAIENFESELVDEENKVNLQTIYDLQDYVKGYPDKKPTIILSKIHDSLINCSEALKVKILDDYQFM